MPWSSRLQPRQNFRNVTTLRGECLCALAVLRIVAQQIAIILQVRSAAGGIAHHGVHLRAFECVNSAPRVIERGLLLARVNHKRAAAALIPGHHHLATFRSQYADSGGIHLGEKNALHTSQQQPHSQATFAFVQPRARRARRLFLRGNRRREVLHCAQAGRKQFEQTAAANEPTAIPSAGKVRAARAAGAVARDAERCQRSFAAKARRVPDAGVVSFDLERRRFDQLVVLHARRTRRQASHAAEAVVHVVYKGGDRGEACPSKPSFIK